MNTYTYTNHKTGEVVSVKADAILEADAKYKEITGVCPTQYGITCAIDHVG